MSGKLQIRLAAIATSLALLAGCATSSPRYVDERGYEICDRCGTVERIVRVYGEGGSTGGGAVAGAIIGGVLGNQIGSGDGRRAATAAGVLIGAAIGADQGRRDYRYRDYPVHREVVRHEQVCEWQEDYRVERELVGYDVTYDYNGYIGHTRTREAPGQEIRVRVSVDPVGY